MYGNTRVIIKSLPHLLLVLNYPLNTKSLFNSDLCRFVAFSSTDWLFTQSTAHARAVCHSPPRPHVHIALTLSRSTRSHTVSLYLVLTLIHVRSRTSCLMVYMSSSSSINVSHRLGLVRIHAIWLWIVSCDTVDSVDCTHSRLALCADQWPPF